MAQQRSGTELPGNTSTCAVRLSLLSSLYVAAAAGFPMEKGGRDFYNPRVVWKTKPRRPVACVGAKIKVPLESKGLKPKIRDWTRLHQG